MYETPGGYILHVAHTDLEVFCMDKEVYRVKQILRDRLSDYVYNGYWYSPEGAYIKKCVTLGEENVTGIVKLELFGGYGTYKLTHVKFSTRKRLKNTFNTASWFNKKYHVILSPYHV